MKFFSNGALRVFLASMVLMLSLQSAWSADTFKFRADKMVGGRATGKEVTVLSGNAQVTSDNLTLRADRIELYGSDNNIVECYGKVTGEESEKQIFFKTDNLVYNRDSKVAKLTGNSTLEDKKNEIVARSRYIEYDDNKEIAVLQISVRLFKEKMVCRSEYAIYRREEELLELSGFPIVYKDEDEFRADKIRVDLNTDDVIMDGSISGTLHGN